MSGQGCSRGLSRFQTHSREARTAADQQRGGREITETIPPPIHALSPSRSLALSPLVPLPLALCHSTRARAPTPTPIHIRKHALYTLPVVTTAILVLVHGTAAQLDLFPPTRLLYFLHPDPPPNSTCSLLISSLPFLPLRHCSSSLSTLLAASSSLSTHLLPTVHLSSSPYIYLPSSRRPLTLPAGRLQPSPALSTPSSRAIKAGPCSFLLVDTLPVSKNSLCPAHC